MLHVPTSVCMDICTEYLVFFYILISTYVLRTDLCISGLVSGLVYGVYMDLLYTNYYPCMYSVLRYTSMDRDASLVWADPCISISSPFHTIPYHTYTHPYIRTYGPYWRSTVLWYRRLCVRLCLYLSLSLPLVPSLYVLLRIPGITLLHGLFSTVHICSVCTVHTYVL